MVAVGLSGGNYNVTLHTASGTISPAALDISATSDSKTYDATTSSAATPTTSGLKGSDTVDGFTQVFDSKNAGSRTLSVTAYTIHDGNSGGNYNVTLHTASGTISPAALDISATSDSKTYDATTSSAATPTTSGLKGSDTVDGFTQVFDSKNAGSRTLSVTAYTIHDGNSGGNYNVTLHTASGTISPAALDISATSDSKTYDATTSSA